MDMKFIFLLVALLLNLSLAFASADGQEVDPVVDICNKAIAQAGDSLKTGQVDLTRDLPGLVRYMMIRHEKKGGQPMTPAEAEAKLAKIFGDKKKNIFSDKVRKTSLDFDERFQILLGPFIALEASATWNQFQRELFAQKQAWDKWLLPQVRALGLPSAQETKFLSELSGRMLDYAVVQTNLAGSFKMNDVGARALRTMFYDDKLRTSDSYKWLQKVYDVSKGDYSKSDLPIPPYDNADLMNP